MKIKFLLLVTIALTLSSCSFFTRTLNPFYEEPSEIALQGEANDHALNEGKSNVETARKTLEAVGQYDAAHTPQPNNPVLRPAVVRLMWIPDHLNSYGDLIPAHYYYLKVLKDSWNLQDSFELEEQIKRQSSGGGRSNIPYTYK